MVSTLTALSLRSYATSMHFRIRPSQLPCSLQINLQSGTVLLGAMIP